MPNIIDYGFEIVAGVNVTAVQGGRYAIKTEFAAVTMTLPASPAEGAAVEAYFLRSGSNFNFVVQGNGKNIYAHMNPYGGDTSNAASITFAFNQWVGAYFVFVFDGGAWNVGLPLTGARAVTFQDYIALHDAEIYMDAADSNNNTQTKPLYFRSADGRNIGDIRGTKVGYNVGTNEGTITCYLGAGGWGYPAAYQVQIASPPRFYCYGELSAASVTNRSDSSLKSDAQPLHPDWLNALMNLPIQTYIMGDDDLPPSEEHPEGRVNTGRRRHIGFYAQDLEALAPEVQKKAAVFQHHPDQPREVDIMSMLSLAIHAIQKLNARITTLEQALEGGK